MSRKQAAYPPFSKNGPPPAPEEGSPGKRSIPKGHSFDPRSLKPMSRALWASSMALGHALAAYREFSRLKSAAVSPDGMMGGHGYVMNVKDIRRKLFEATESLSSISDTLYDEINAPHWKPKMALLDNNEREDVEKFVDESAEVLRSPEDNAADEMSDLEAENDTASKMPSGGPGEEASVPKMPKMASSRLKRAAEALTERILVAIEHGEDPEEAALAFLQASTLPVDTLPGGPRVDHRGPAEGRGPWGSYNDAEPWSDAELDDDGYLYKSEWENDLSVNASSALPQDSTPTEAWDFGLGFGARGQGPRSYSAPAEGGDARSVWGPASKMPTSQSKLPQDEVGPPARSDYYDGFKGNLVQSEAMLPDGDPAPWSEAIPVGSGHVHEDLNTPYVRMDNLRHERPRLEDPDTAPWGFDD